MALLQSPRCRPVLIDRVSDAARTLTGLIPQIDDSPAAAMAHAHAWLVSLGVTREQAMDTESDGQLPNSYKPSRPWLQRVFESLWSGLVKPAVALLVVAVIPLCIVFANTQIKELFDRFTAGCVFVLDKRMSVGGSVLVTAQLAGTPPKALPIMFEGRNALLNNVVFEEAYREDQILDPDDLAFHPSTGARCPGTLCPDTGRNPDRIYIEATLTDLRPEFTYRFRVAFTQDAAASAPHVDNLKVYSMFRPGLDDGVCRVQPRRWFNYWVWATPLKKSLMFLGIVVVAGLLLRWTKGKVEGS